MKHILIQYIDLIQEQEETQKRIQEIEYKLERINEEGNVKDVVKGGQGGWQTFHIEGFPVEDADENIYLLTKHKRILKNREADISDKLLEVEVFLSKMDDSRLRRIITKKYIEGKTWYRVAYEMGNKYSEESCRKLVERFLKTLEEKK